MRRRIDIEADHVTLFVDELGVFGQLKLPDAMRQESTAARQMRRTDEALMPAALAIAAPVQCVVSPERLLHGQRDHALGDGGVEA